MLPQPALKVTYNFSALLVPILYPSGMSNDDDDWSEEEDNESAVLFASVLATVCWQVEERSVLTAFVKWLEFAAESPPSPPLRRTIVVSEAWKTWIERTNSLMRCRKLARSGVARFFRTREWRRAACRFAIVRWRSILFEEKDARSSTSELVLSMALCVERAKGRRNALAAAFGTWRLLTSRNEDRSAVSEEVARVAAEHLERATATNRDLRKAASKAVRKGRHLAIRLMSRVSSRVSTMSLLEESWCRWTAELRAPRRLTASSLLGSEDDDERLAVAALEPNRVLLQRIFKRYSVGGATPDGATTLVLTLERLWSLAKDFCISPGFASYTLLMQLAHDEFVAPRPSSPLAATPKQRRKSLSSSSSSSKRHHSKSHHHRNLASSLFPRYERNALAFDQFISLLAAIAVRGSASSSSSGEDDDDSTVFRDSPEIFVAALIRAMDCSGGLAKIGIHNKRFVLPKPLVSVARQAWS